MNTQWTLEPGTTGRAGPGCRGRCRPRSHTRLLFAKEAGHACPAHFLLEAAGGAAPGPHVPGTKGLSCPHVTTSFLCPASRQLLAGAERPRRAGRAEGLGRGLRPGRRSQPVPASQPQGPHGRSGAWALHAVSPRPVPRPRESRGVQPGPVRGQCHPRTAQPGLPPTSSPHTCTCVHTSTRVHTCTHVHAHIRTACTHRHWPVGFPRVPSEDPRGSGPARGTWPVLGSASPSVRICGVSGPRGSFLGPQRPEHSHCCCPGTCEQRS